MTPSALFDRTAAIASSSVAKAGTRFSIRRGDWFAVLAALLTVGLCLPFFLWVLPSCRPFPYTDEWSYLGPMSNPTLRWLFRQNIDHRIPIQKLLHLFLLRGTRFDFRSLTAASFLTGALASLFFIAAARAYRGFASVGDLFIPLCLLSLGSAFSQWGFEFQFLSSVLCASAFLFFAAKRWLAAAFVTLFLCAWCGLNGMLISTFVSFVMAGYVVVYRSKIGPLAWSLLATAVATNVILWIAWVPSGLFSGRPSIKQFMDLLALVVGSPFLMFASVPLSWRIVAMAALILGGAVAVLVALFRDTTFRSVAVMAMMGASLVLIASTTYGRARIYNVAHHANQSVGRIPYLSAVQMHYGCLAVLLPIVAWIALSGPAVDRRLSTVIGLLLVALFASSYWSNYQWREVAAVADRAAFRKAALAVGGNADPHTVAGLYTMEFFSFDSVRSRRIIASGIPLLRQLWH